MGRNRAVRLCVPGLTIGSLILLAGCASFSTAIRPVEVAPRSETSIALKAGIRDAEIKSSRAGGWLVASQPKVKKALQNESQVRSDFTKAFTDYCREAKLFSECVSEPFDNSQVQLEIRPKLVDLNNRATYGTWLVTNLVTLNIPALLGWPYKNQTDCELEVEVRSPDEKFAKTYSGKGFGQKNTNIYALIFGIREVPHAMLSVNRSVTAAFEEVAKQIEADKSTLASLSTPGPAQAEPPSPVESSGAAPEAAPSPAEMEAPIASEPAPSGAVPEGSPSPPAEATGSAVEEQTPPPEETGAPARAEDATPSAKEAGTPAVLEEEKPPEPAESESPDPTGEAAPSPVQ